MSAPSTRKAAGRRRLEFQTLDDVSPTRRCWPAPPASARSEAGRRARSSSISRSCSTVKSTGYRCVRRVFRMIGRYFIKKRIKKGMPGSSCRKDSIAVLVPPATTTIEEGLGVFGPR